MKWWVAILGFVVCMLAVVWIAGLYPRAGEKIPLEPLATVATAVAPPAAPAATDPIRVYDVAAVEVQRNNIGLSKYRIRFSVRNNENTPRTVWANPFTTDFIPGGQSFLIPAESNQENLEVIAKMVQPSLLVISCGAYRTNCPLNW